MLSEVILFILEIIGAIAFAISGVFVAIKARFGIFGVLVIGCITAVGGGITRDMLIGANPPAIFSKIYIIGITCLASLIVFIVAYRAEWISLRVRSVKRLAVQAVVL